MRYSSAEKSFLLTIALNSIYSGLEYGKPARPDKGSCTVRLKEKRASFVTLEHGNELRGCIGTLEARTSLVESIAENTYAAAFSDPRFPVLTTSEVDKLTIQISVLSTPQPVTVASEQELLTLMNPGEAGWVLQEKGNRGTFLPSVWSELGEPLDFLQHLKIKAGLPPDYWSGSIEFWRYITVSFSAPVVEIKHL